MAITTTRKYTVDLDKGGLREPLRSPLSTLNSKAHTFAVTVMQGSAAASLSGAKCRAWFIRADGVTVPIDGAVSGNVASVTLLPNCYAVQGRFELTVELTSSDVIHTILRVDGSILRTRTDSLTTGGSTVQSFDELMSAFVGNENALSKRNRVTDLLDNSNFLHPVNQRGRSTYTGAGYTIDRWRTNFSGDTVEVTTNGVKNTVTSTSSGWHMHQILDNGAALTGKNITAACYAVSVTGNLYLMISCRDSSDTEIGNSYKKITAGLCVASMTVPSGTQYIRVGVYAYSSSVAAGDNVTLQWAALYEGDYTADALPSYQPKGYAVELAECRRYYKRYYATSNTYALCLSGYISGSGKDVIVGIPASMRIKPTITLNGAIAIRDANGYVVNLDGYASPSCTATGPWENDWASIYFRKNDGSAWGGTNNTLCSVCLCENTTMEVSADL